MSVELWNGNVWARGVLGELGIALCFSREGVQVLAVEGPCKAVAQPGQRAWRQLLGGTSMAAGPCRGGLVGKVSGSPGLGASRLPRCLWLCQAQPGDAAAAAAEREQQNWGLELDGSLPPQSALGLCAITP